MKRGELLATFSAGAYGMAMSSNYNGRPRAAEVLAPKVIVVENVVPVQHDDGVGAAGAVVSTATELAAATMAVVVMVAALAAASLRVPPAKDKALATAVMPPAASLSPAAMAYWNTKPVVPVPLT